MQNYLSSVTVIYNLLYMYFQDTLHPPVLILTPNSFDDLIGHKPTDEMWMVDFYAPWCGPCQQLAPEWRKLAKMLTNNKKIKVAQMDCQKYREMCHRQNVNSYPTIRLYPTGSKNAHVYQ